MVKIFVFLVNHLHFQTYFKIIVTINVCRTVCHMLQEIKVDSSEYYFSTTVLETLFFNEITK